METLTIKVLRDLPKGPPGVGGQEAGETVKVEAKGGVPVERYWRDRLKDSEIDGCVELAKKSRQDKGDDK